MRDNEQINKFKNMLNGNRTMDRDKVQKTEEGARVWALGRVWLRR